MKREGDMYEKMCDWNALVLAEQAALRNKKKNLGYRKHEKNWMRDLVKAYDIVLQHKMRTGAYRRSTLKSKHNKTREIAKLDFFPSHIFHQLLVRTAERRIDKSLIRHTYASRTGYGQHKAAKTLNKWVQKCGDEYLWYAKFDIVKYYENIPHALIEERLRRLFKDEEFIECMLEPIRKFAPNGVGIPLGIRPSQIFGNLALSGLDRHIKETLHCRYYMRYLDDFIIFCHTKAEAKRKRRAICKFVEGIGFKLHPVRIDRIANGIDMLGYVTYPKSGQFVRRKVKGAWLERRYRVTDKSRLREIDSAMWGYVVHGNKHCKKLYNKMGGINFGKLGIDTSKTDKNGARIIDAQVIPVSTCVGQRCEITDVVGDVETKYGKGRVVIQLTVFGQNYKMITNSPFKQPLIEAWSRGVTRLTCTFVCKNGKHYDISDVDITEVNHRQVYEKDGIVLYRDNNEIVKL